MSEEMQKRFAIQGNKIDDINKKVDDGCQKVIEQLVVYDTKFSEIKDQTPSISLSI